MARSNNRLDRKPQPFVVRRVRTFRSCGGPRSQAPPTPAPRPLGCEGSRCRPPEPADGGGPCGWAAPRPRPTARRRPSAAPAVRSTGVTVVVPELAASRPRIIRSVVDFPAPVGIEKSGHLPWADGERQVSHSCDAAGYQESHCADEEGDDAQDRARRRHAPVRISTFSSEGACVTRLGSRVSPAVLTCTPDGLPHMVHMVHFGGREGTGARRAGGQHQGFGDERNTWFR